MIDHSSRTAFLLKSDATRQRRVFHFFLYLLVFLAYISPLHSQKSSRLYLAPDLDLINELKKIESAGITFAYDQNIKCRPVINDIIRTQFFDLEERLYKTACYCQLECVEIDKNQWLLRNASDDHRFNIVTLIDAIDSSPISFALVTIPDLHRQFISDIEGNVFFSFNQPEKDIKLRIQSLQYGENLISLTDIKHHKILLTPKVFTLPKVTYRPNNIFPGRESKGATILKNNNDKSATYGQFSNATGAITLPLPGIVITHDKGGVLRLRGSEQSATLLTVDNMPIYKAEHFFGIFSALNPDFIDKIIVHKNNIPVEHGGRTSGMLEYLSKETLSRSDILLHANLLQTGLKASVKGNNNLGVIAAGRISYANIVQSPLFNALVKNKPLNDQLTKNNRTTILSTPSFDFKDFNAKAFYHLENHKFSVGVFGSADVFKDSYNAKIETRLGLREFEIFKRDENWQNLAFNFQHEYQQQKFRFSSVFYSTQFWNTQNLMNRIPSYNKYDSLPPYRTLENINLIKDFGLKSTLTVSTVGGNTKLGVESIRHYNELSIAGLNNIFFEYISQPWEHNIFADREFVFRHDLLVRPGLRASYIPSVKNWYLQPQLYIQKYISCDWKVKSSYSRHSQFMRQFLYETPTGLIREFFVFANNTSIPVGNSDNWMVGLSYENESFGFLMDIEGFYRSLDGSLNYATKRLGVLQNEEILGLVDFNLFKGESRIYGADVGIHYASKDLLITTQYTWSKNENRYREVFNNQWHPSPQDSRHQIRTALFYKMKNFNFSLSFTCATGLPYLDLAKLNNTRDREKLNPYDIIQTLPNFYRTDIGLQYNLITSTNTFDIGLSVYNVFNRKNVVQRQYFSQIRLSKQLQNPLESDVLQLGRIYNIGLSLRL